MKESCYDDDDDAPVSTRSAFTGFVAGVVTRNNKKKTKYCVGTVYTVIFGDIELPEEQAKKLKQLCDDIKKGDRVCIPCREKQKTCPKVNWDCTARVGFVSGYSKIIVSFEDEKDSGKDCQKKCEKDAKEFKRFILVRRQEWKSTN